MPSIKLTPEQTIIYNNINNPIIQFLWEHCGDPDGGNVWNFRRVYSHFSSMAGYEMQINLYIYDPEVAVLFKIMFG